MVPLRLLLRNFLCYRNLPNGEPLTLDLSGLHVVCLSGENGAGKSSLLDAMTWALWGEARSSDDDLITQGEADMLVDLVFELSGRRHRVIRTRSRGKTTRNGTQSAGKSSLDLQIMSDDGNWRSHSQNTIRETQDEINRVLRMSYRTFINASFLLQGRADEFTSRTPAERKQVLAEILDLSAYARLETAARERSRALLAELQGIRGKIEAIGQTAGMLDYWREQTEAAELRVTGLRERQLAVTAELEQAAQQVRALEEVMAQRRELAGRAQEIRTRIVGRESELERLEQRMAADRAVQARAAEITAGFAQLRSARGRLSDLDRQREQHLNLESRRLALAERWINARNAFKIEVDRAALRRDTLREQLAEAEHLTAQISRLEAAIAAAADLDGALDAARERQAAASEALQERRRIVQRLQHLREQAAQERRAAEQRRSELQRRLTRLEQQVQQLPTVEARLSAAEAAAAAVTVHEAELAACRADEQQARDDLSRLRSEVQAIGRQLERLATAASLLEQGSGPCPVCRRDLDGDAGELALAHYADERSALTERLAADQAAIQAGEARLATCVQAGAQAEQRLVQTRSSAQARTQALEQLQQLQAAAAEADELRAELDGLEAMLSSPAAPVGEQAQLTAQLHQMGEEQLLQEQQQATAEVTRLEQRLRERTRQDAERNSLQQRRTALAAAEAALPAAEAAAAELETRYNARDFSHDLREAGVAVREALDQLNFQQEEWEAVRAEVDQLSAWEDEQRTLELAQQRLESDRLLADQSRQLLAHDHAAYNTAQQEIAGLDLHLQQMPELRRQVAELQREMTQRAQGLRGAELELQEQLTYLRAAEAATQQLLELQQIERDTAARRDLYAELAVAFGKSGVQAMLIETAIPQIEDEANAILGRLSDGRLHVTLDTQRDTKKGDAVETLDIRIADGLGTRSYDAFSGGEALRVNFALRIALSRLLAQRAGASLETLVIDEGFGVLDAVGRERMVEAIGSVQDAFKRIIVITHIDELKERFPATIEVRKTAQGSRWELR